MEKVIQGSFSFLMGFVLSVILLGCGDVIVVYSDGSVEVPKQDSKVLSDSKVVVPDSKVIPDSKVLPDSGIPKTDTQPEVKVSVTIQAQKYLLASTENASKPTWIDLSDGSIMSFLKGSDGDQWCDGSNYVIYEVSITTPGLYYLYFTGRYGTAADGVTGTEGLNDSFFISPDFGMRPSTKMNAYDGDFLNSAGENFLNITSGMYKTTKKYQVQTTGVYRFMVGAREDGMVLNSFTFSTDSNLLK
jgi:hypothetical protein